MSTENSNVLTVAESLQQEGLDRAKAAYAHGMRDARKTDLEAFTDMLRISGYVQTSSEGYLPPLGFDVRENQQVSVHVDGRHFFKAGLTCITVSNGIGSSGFHTKFYFDEGKLYVHGVFE